MEGIVDGAARDTCFLCGLLYPRALADDCPRCGRRMRYEPAAVMDPVALEEAVRVALAGYRGAADSDRDRARAALEELLALLHRFSPEALEVLVRAGGPGIAELRADWEALGGERPS